MLDKYDIVRLNISLSCECGQEERGGGGGRRFNSKLPTIYCLKSIVINLT